MVEIHNSVAKVYEENKDTLEIFECLDEFSDTQNFCDHYGFDIEDSCNASPLGLPENIKVYMDKNVTDREKLFIGAGNRVSKFFLSPETLIQLSNATVLDLT